MGLLRDSGWVPTATEQQLDAVLEAVLAEASLDIVCGRDVEVEVAGLSPVSARSLDRLSGEVARLRAAGRQLVRTRRGPLSVRLRAFEAPSPVAVAA